MKRVVMSALSQQFWTGLYWNNMVTIMWVQLNGGGGCAGDSVNWGDLLAQKGEAAAVTRYRTELGMRDRIYWVLEEELATKSSSLPSPMSQVRLLRHVSSIKTQFCIRDNSLQVMIHPMWWSTLTASSPEEFWQKKNGIFYPHKISATAQSPEENCKNNDQIGTMCFKLIRSTIICFAYYSHITESSVILGAGPWKDNMHLYWWRYTSTAWSTVCSKINHCHCFHN